MGHAASSDYFAIRQGERSDQDFKASAAQVLVLSVWHTLQALGIFIESVSAGLTKWNVWLRTFTSPIVWAIFGMWQAMHSLPALPAL